MNLCFCCRVTKLTPVDYRYPPKDPSHYWARNMVPSMSKVELALETLSLSISQVFLST